MESALDLISTSDSPRSRLSNRSRLAVVALVVLVAWGLAIPKASAASESLQPFGQHVSCYNGSWATTANIYPGAFSSNGYLAYPTQRLHYYAVTNSAGQTVASGWTQNVVSINTAYLTGTHWDFWLVTWWTDPGLGNLWTSTGDYVYLGRCY